MRFNPRSPCGGSDLAAHHAPDKALVSTPAPLAGSDPRRVLRALPRLVSTHAPLAGSDGTAAARRRSRRCRFNPRSPCGERRVLHASYLSQAKFLPTLPLRGATFSTLRTFLMSRLQPHAPLAGSDVRGHERRLVERVSTHAPLAGSDPLQTLAKDPVVKFQPTLPLRGATSPRGPSRRPPSRFNPRSPCGERRRCTTI